jgi:glycerophosphoryl diester phosphodiesterase
MNILNLLPAMCALSAASSLFAAQIIAHRGASFDAPENTVLALKLGYQQGADAGECDIHLTKDGKIVILHDYDTGRTGGEKHLVKETGLATLRQIDVAQWDKWKDKGFSEKVPLLEEALAVIPDGKRLFIEIKCGPEVLPELERVLKAAGKKPAQTPIIGFNYETVRQTKARMPQLEVCWLVSSDSKTKEFPPIEEIVAKAKAAKLDGLDLNSGFPINKQFVETVKKAGLKLYAWTVDDPAVAKAEVQAGVDGITTNRPEWLRKQLSLAAP